MASLGAKQSKIWDLSWSSRPMGLLFNNSYDTIGHNPWVGPYVVEGILPSLTRGGGLTKLLLLDRGLRFLSGHF